LTYNIITAFNFLKNMRQNTQSNRGTKINKNQNIPLQGFTLIEILLVVAIIAILAGIVIFAINPAKQLAESRNAQRRSDVNTISNAIYQYMLDHNGFLPADTVYLDLTCGNLSDNQICRTDHTCNGLTDLSILTAEQKYLVSIPTDPIGSGADNTGYFVSTNYNGKITVCAPSAEESATISVTR
jgi:prepilin-type N-terminal cleavage/methylation domain-containing protein